MIVYFWEKSKTGLRKWGILVLILLVELYCAFIWSKMLLREEQTVQIMRTVSAHEHSLVVENTQKQDTYESNKNAFVASKKGKYYYPRNCSKAKSLSVKNMLYFKDKIDAERAGYLMYLGCN